ncbi:non-hydrolyzing UDP-N-acetylglucosamine 2-epimerase [Methanobacterium spitsbergense]|uniref:UDP-N-acetylglucosamine 2-epimerase (Non-hydrolyzing) n=1 Tax=Methanobacterium spitsbergense TaxID=2874285 RepID=A0A8T5UYB4_9EURY|nr:UDP-N-acetylglucosamine 2-epimerase (non-hydrolyzing) [Methanobacterium spitsbergense]MBZ2166170.1 UDP-N-acetylglucosamine 2-epimerase (non-hydrolyzing) [Methanobacterium spitsbergense]
MKIATIFGTRPEIIKLSTLIPLLDRDFNQILIHTGQHYSYKMDKIFFEDLDLRDCDYSLNIGSGTHGKQTGNMLMELENVLLHEKPELVIVQGDTNSTLAGALAASKLQIPVAHVEAGCRSFDRRMPEEINRVLVDHISDYLFAPDLNSFKNLTLSECIPSEKVYLVGNTSVDACIRAMKIFNRETLEDYSLKKDSYILFTLHRQENTTYESLKEILMALNIISNRIKVFFPVHLRTKKVIEDNNIEINDNVILSDPLGYKDFMGLLTNSMFVMTDSGGIQEESVVLNVPCLIIRDNTEWMIYVEIGKNLLLGTNHQKIVDIVNKLLDNPEIIEKMKLIEAQLNQGASESIVSILKNIQ